MVISGWVEVKLPGWLKCMSSIRLVLLIHIVSAREDPFSDISQEKKKKPQSEFQQICYCFSKKEKNLLHRVV